MSTFDFLGFEASLQLECFANLGLARLMDMVPPKSRSDAYLILSDSGEYEGSIKIQTYQGKIQASRCGKDPFRVLTELSHDMVSGLLDLAVQAHMADHAFTEADASDSDCWDSSFRGEERAARAPRRDWSKNLA